MTTLERRTFTGDIEFRGVKGSSRMVAAGYAAKFGVRSQAMKGFVEQIEKRAFAKTIQEADVRALFNHEPHALLGRTGAGTLRLGEDSIGLAYEIDLPDTSLGRDIATLLERGDLTGSSFGFRTIDDGWSKTESGYPLRSLKQVALVDVGPATYPAYTDSSVSLQRLAETRSLSLDEVIAAAETDSLSEVIEPPESQEKQEDEDSREALTVVRHKFLHLT